MGINGIGAYSYFQSDYRVNDIPKVDAVSAVQEATDVDHQENLILQLEEESFVAANRKPVNPNEISMSINKNEDYSFIGRDKDIHNLDMQKAISTMKQDTILQDYNYFVGNSKNIYQSEDGVVLLK